MNPSSGQDRHWSGAPVLQWQIRALRYREQGSDRFQSEGRSGDFKRAQVIFRIGRRCRIEDESYPGNARRNLLEILQPLAGHGWLNVSEPGDVAARARKTLSEAGADRIGNDNKDDGDVGRAACR